MLLYTFAKARDAEWRLIAERGTRRNRTDRGKALVATRQDCWGVRTLSGPRIRRSIVHPPNSFLRCRTGRGDAKCQFITQMRTIGIRSTWKPDWTPCVDSEAAAKQQSRKRLSNDHTRLRPCTVAFYLRSSVGGAAARFSKTEAALRSNEINDVAVYSASKTAAALSPVQHIRSLRLDYWPDNASLPREQLRSCCSTISLWRLVFFLKNFALGSLYFSHLCSQRTQDRLCSFHCIETCVFSCGVRRFLVSIRNIYLFAAPFILL